MERDDKSVVRKRGRDEDDEKSESSSTSSSSSSSSLSHKSKKQEFLTIDLIKDDKQDIDDDSYHYHDEGIGIFDFPWLKESSVVFQVKDYLEVELDMFAACLDVGPDQGSGPEGSLWELGFGGEGFMWSSCKIEDLEPVEFVWRCVCIDNVYNNKDDQHRPVENRVDLVPEKQ